ncbi:MAG: hypothetical protein ACKVVP_17105 [Chloroflexota bacterium]
MSPFTIIIQASVLAAALTLAAPVTRMHANGNPVSIVLSYLNGVSNWGPTNATGVAEMVPREGEARITVTGLSRLSGEQYVVWIMNSVNNEKMALGGFNTAENGVGKLELTTKDPFPDKGWDTVYVSVEATGALPVQSSNRRAIAGKWPVPGTQQGKPNELPNTGGVTAEPVSGQFSGSTPWLTVLAGLVLAIVVSGVLGFRVARTRQRRAEG